MSTTLSPIQFWKYLFSPYCAVGIGLATWRLEEEAFEFFFSTVKYDLFACFDKIFESLIVLFWSRSCFSSFVRFFVLSQNESKSSSEDVTLFVQDLTSVQLHSIENDLGILCVSVDLSLKIETSVKDSLAWSFYTIEYSMDSNPYQISVENIFYKNHVQN